MNKEELQTLSKKVEESLQEQYKKVQDFIKKGQPKEVIDAESYLQNVGENGNVLLQEISYLTQIKTLLQDTIAIESRNRARIE